MKLTATDVRTSAHTTELFDRTNRFCAASLIGFDTLAHTRTHKTIFRRLGRFFMRLFVRHTTLDTGAQTALSTQLVVFVCELCVRGID